MADFTGVIRRAVDGLANNTPEARQKVYDRARQTIQRQLEAMPNSSSSAIFERQLSSVEDAIKQIEAEYAGGQPAQAEASTPPASTLAASAPTPPVTTSPAPTTPAPVAPVIKPAAPEEQAKAPVVEEPKTEPVSEAPKPVEPAPTPKPEPFAPKDEPVAEPDVEPEQTKAPEVEEVVSADEPPRNDAPVIAPVAEPEPESELEIEPESEAEKVPETLAVESAQEVKEDISEPIEETPSSNEIDDELAIPVVENSVEAASVVDDKVSEIVSDVASKIDADKSGKEMPKADSSFLTDDSIIDQAVGEIKSSLQADTSETNPDFPDHDATFGFGAEALPEAPEPKRKKSPIVMIIAAILLVLAGSAYGVWRYGLGGFGGGETQIATAEDTSSQTEQTASEGETPEEREVVTKVEETTPAAEETAPVGDAEKFTQRLNADGTEEDVGPSPEVINGLPGEEGRSVAELSGGETTTELAQQPEAAADGTPAIEKMLFYETSLGLEQQARYEGGVTWSEEVESDGTASRPFIRAQIQVPERNLSIDMSIKLNGDQTLPVSHLIDINFSLPDDFEGGEIDQVTEVKMKNTEEQPGDRLVAISAKIDTTFFVVGLENDDQDVVATNLQLLSRRNWIDIPISYSNGRKALITLEKGASGVAIFDKVLAAWERSPVQ